MFRHRAIVLFFLTAVLQSGCGTPHMFIPPQGLEEDQWEVGVTWSADVNGLLGNRSYVNIGVNAWVGMDERTTLGFGSSGLVVPCHLSVARYEPKSDGNIWVPYLSVRPFPGSFSTLIEAGCAYTIPDSTYEHVLAFGVGFGLWDPWNQEGTGVQNSALGLNRLLPTIRYQLGGNDVAFSWIYTPGKTGSLITLTFPNVTDSAEIIYSAERIDSITIGNKPRHWKSIPDESIVVWLRDGKIETYYREWYFAGCVAFVNMAGGQFEDWMGDRYSSALRPDSAQHMGREKYYVVDLYELRAAAEQHRVITIYNYPESFRKRVQRLNWLTADHSFGITYHGHDPKR